MKIEAKAVQVLLSGAQWADKSEAHACLISEHLSPDTVQLDKHLVCASNDPTCESTPHQSPH
jgi:hypothetical protein